MAVQGSMTTHQLPASLRKAGQSIVIVGYDDGIFSALEGDDRDVIFAVGRTLRELAREEAVLVWAPRAERGLKALLMTADQVVWNFDERPAASMRTRRRRAVQATSREQDEPARGRDDGGRGAVSLFPVPASSGAGASRDHASGGAAPSIIDDCFSCLY